MEKQAAEGAIPFSLVDAVVLGKSYEHVRQEYCWLDVRTAEEYEEGHIPGALHIPHDELSGRWKELASQKNSKIVIICKSGARSAYAASVLATQGFRSVFNMLGGMDAWTGPVESSPS